MKYVVLTVNLADTKKAVPIIFPDFMVHDDLVKSVTTLLEEVHKLKVTGILSAGEIDMDQVFCSGYSSTLKVYSRDEEDDNLIESYDYMHGMLGETE